MDFKWGLRIAPDETYWDEGAGTNAHAAYEIFFGLFDPNAQRMLDSFNEFGYQRMEDELVELMNSKEYAGRSIAPKVPLKFARAIFVDGFPRMSHGTVAGFALPNWGPHAMAKKWIIGSMASPERREHFYRTYLGEEYVQYAVGGASTANTVTHEIFHGLGPQDETQVRDEHGQTKYLENGEPLTVRQALTPAVHQVLEEAKASFVYLWFDKKVEEAGIIDARTRKERNAAGVIWAFGHLLRELFNAEGKIKTYSAVGAMMLGSLMQEGAVSYNEQRGAWDIDFDRVPDVAGEMLRRITRIQATGDREAGQALIDSYTKDAELLKLIRYEDIVKRARDAKIRPTVGRYQVIIDE